jgi:hypothetical protein
MNSRKINCFCVICAFLFLLVLTTCGGGTTSSEDGNDNEPTRTYYMVVPGAQFFSGSPAGSQSATVTATPTVSALTDPTFETGWLVQWAVTWPDITEITVTDIIITIPDIDGYFDYMLSDDELTYEFADITMELVEDSVDQTEWCNHDYRGNGICYAEVPATTTDEQYMNFSAAQFLDASQEFNWSPYMANGYFIYTNSDDDDGGNGGDGDGDGDGDGGGTDSDYCYTVDIGCSVSACTNEDATYSWYIVNGFTVYCGATFTTTCAESAVAYCGY